MADLLAARLGLGRHERRGGDDLTRGAEAALEGVLAHERTDERVVAKPLDRRHLASADGVDERDAGEHRHAVQLHGAGTAVTLAARDLRPGQAEVLAQRLRERASDRRVELVVVTVDAEARHGG